MTDCLDCGSLLSDEDILRQAILCDANGVFSLMVDGASLIPFNGITEEDSLFFITEEDSVNILIEE